MSKIKTLEFSSAGEAPQVTVHSDGRRYGEASPAMVNFPVRYEAECRYKSYLIEKAHLVHGEVTAKGTVIEAWEGHTETIGPVKQNALKSPRLALFGVPVDALDLPGMCEAEHKHWGMSLAEFMKKPRELHVKMKFSFVVHCRKFGAVFDSQQEYGVKTIWMPMVVQCMPKPGSRPKPVQGTAGLDRTGPEPRAGTTASELPAHMRRPIGRVAEPEPVRTAAKPRRTMPSPIRPEAAEKAGPKPRSGTSTSGRPARKGTVATPKPDRT